MASIQKRNNSYKITVSCGRDMAGKQLRHYLTWTPEPKMTTRQIEKELQRVAFEFEQKIEQGFSVDTRQNFGGYARYVIDLKERTGAKHRTITRYLELLVRIDEAIGHIKLSELKPQHLNAFYKNLTESGIRAGGDKAISCTDIPTLLKRLGYSRAKVAELAGISSASVTAATKGERVTLATAGAIAGALGRGVEELFTVEKNTTPLSNKTILEYHRLISTILVQAEKEMLVPYNAAAKSTPPKLEKKEAETFQPEEVERIRACLETEPIKWRTATHLLLITGCRRGEVIGLKWDKIDWENNQIKIDRALLYSRDIGVYEDTTKTSTARFIKLPQETMGLLHEYYRWYLEQQLLNGDRWKNSGYLFAQSDGAPMNPDSITNWLAKFSKRHALPNVHPHKFRHTMASLLYYNGIDSITISKRLGHAKVSTTTDIYSHIIKQADEQASECIADAVLRPQKKNIIA